MASQMSNMVAVRGQQQAIAYQAPAFACGPLIPLTSLESNGNIGKNHEVRRMDIDFETCKVRVERERWFDSQGNPHEWLSFRSEPIAHMESIIDEFRRQNEVNSIFHKHVDLHSQHLEGVVRALHVASQNDNCLHSEIAKVRGEIVDWDKRLNEFLNQLTKEVQHIGPENASLKTTIEGDTSLRDRQISWLSRALKCLVGEGFQVPPSPLKEIPLLDRVSQRIDRLEEDLGRLEVSNSQATAAASMMEEACKLCGKDVANLWGDVNKRDIALREFVENEIFKVQDHYEAKVRLMSHEHSESVASMRAAHLGATEKVEKACHGKTETCEKNFQEQVNHLTHLISALSDSSSSSHVSSCNSFCDSRCSCMVEFRKAQSKIETRLTGVELVNATLGQEFAECSSSMRANETSLRSLLQGRASKEQHAGNFEFTTRIGAFGDTSGGSGQCGDNCPLSCSCRTDIREVRNDLEASIGTHEDKFRHLHTSICELRGELVGLSREQTIKHEPINSASSSSIAALTLDVSKLQREVAAVRLAIEGWEHDGVDEAKEYSDDESFQVGSSGRSGGHANRRTRSVESMSSAFDGRGRDNASKRSTSAPCAAKKNILGVVGDNFYWGDGERYTPSIFSRPHMLHRNITQGKLPTLDVPKPSVSGICQEVRSSEQTMLGTMFPYGVRSSGGNDEDELDDEYGEFGDEYQGIFSGDKNVSFGDDMVFEKLESFHETKDLGEPDAGPEGIQRHVCRFFGLTGSSKPDLEALDDDSDLPE